MEWHVSLIDLDYCFGFKAYIYVTFVFNHLLLSLTGGISECLHKGRIEREKTIKG